MTRLVEVTDKHTFQVSVVDPATGKRRLVLVTRSGTDPNTGQRVLLDRNGLAYVASQQSPQLQVRAMEHDELVEAVAELTATEQAPAGFFASLIYTRQGNHAGSGFIRHVGTAPNGLNLYENNVGNRFVARVNGGGVEYADGTEGRAG